MSTTISALIFLPLAPVAMWVCHRRGVKAERRRLLRAAVEEVEHYLIVRTRG